MLVEVAPVVQPGQVVGACGGYHALLEFPLVRHVAVDAQHSCRVAEHVEDGALVDLERLRLPADGCREEGRILEIVRVHHGIAQHDAPPAVEVAAYHALASYVEIVLGALVDVDDGALVVEHHDGVGHRVDEYLQLGLDVSQVRHIVGHADGAHDGAVVVYERRLVRLELAHAASRLHLLVEQECRARAHGLFLGFQAHELALRVLVGRDVPYIVVSSALHLVLRLAHRLAERVVHLEVGAVSVLEPHELGDGVDGGVEVLLREGQVGVALRRPLQPGELECSPRPVERARPQRVDHPVVLRRPARRLGGVGYDRHGAVERVEPLAPSRREVRKAARRPGPAR